MATGHPKPRPTGARADGGPITAPEEPIRAEGPVGEVTAADQTPADQTPRDQIGSPARTPISRIVARRDFLAANGGVRVPSTAFILLVKPTGLGETRAGFTVSKKVGNSVARNRARRRLREATRIAMPDAAVPGADHVFIARRTQEERPFADLVRDTGHALAKARRKLAGSTPPSA